MQQSTVSYIEDLVAKAPSLTTEQRDRIATLMRSATDRQAAPDLSALREAMQA